MIPPGTIFGRSLRTEATTVEAALAARGEAAREATEQGQAHLDAGDLVSAARWFDRALRLAPGNDTLILLRATARLAAGPTGAREAAEALTGLVARHDIREAWLALVAARLRLGDGAGAADALAHLFARHVCVVDMRLRQLADAVARLTGAPGWACLTTKDTLESGPVAATWRFHLDGRSIALSRIAASRHHATTLSVTDATGQPAIGSPIDLAHLRRVEGFVEAIEGGLVGWAWHPANPDAAVTLSLRASRGKILRVSAEGEVESAAMRPLARPRRFSLPASAVPQGLLHIRGPDGRDLLGSPLDPGLEARSAIAIAGGHAAPFAAAAAALAGPPAIARPAREVAVVVPVHGGEALTLACLDRLAATIPPRTRLIVVDDASPQPSLAAALDRLAARRTITLLRLPRNRGFPAAANAGLALARGDAVLLNSDTLPTQHWLERLREAAHTAPAIGTATPLSNDATIASYPDIAGNNPLAGEVEGERLARLAHRANAGHVVDVPTAIGFCMYIKRDCLAAVGPLREDLFAQGYGEENDFCIRARHLGWRHVVAPGVYVGHLGGGSFGAARTRLIARNQAILERLHPGYGALIAAHEAADPLAEARRRIDTLRWRRRTSRGGAVLLVTHDMGGGVRRQVLARARAIAGQGMRPILLTPDLLKPGVCLVREANDDAAFPNLRYRMPAERDALRRLLKADRPRHAEVHHLLGHDRAILDLLAELGLSYDAHIHDYAVICPRIALVDAQRRYCGEPEPAICEACIADAGRHDDDDIPVASLRRRSATDLARAARVIVPADDVAARLRRHFPTLVPTVEPWERGTHDPPHPPRRPTQRVCIIGAIGVEKGYDVLLAAARDAAWHRLALDYVLVGHSVDDARLLATGRVFVTGEYREAELPALIAAQNADIAFIPSIWPETWCFALSAAFAARLPVVAFDIGTQAERIRALGGGTLLPLGLPPAAINRALLAAGIPSSPASTPAC